MPYKIKLKERQVSVTDEAPGTYNAHKFEDMYFVTLEKSHVISWIRDMLLILGEDLHKRVERGRRSKLRHYEDMILLSSQHYAEWKQALLEAKNLPVVILFMITSLAGSAQTALVNCGMDRFEDEVISFSVTSECLEVVTTTENICLDVVYYDKKVQGDCIKYRLEGKGGHIGTYILCPSGYELNFSHQGCLYGILKKS